MRRLRWRGARCTRSRRQQLRQVDPDKGDCGEVEPADARDLEIRGERYDLRSVTPGRRWSQLDHEGMAELMMGGTAEQIERRRGGAEGGHDSRCWLACRRPARAPRPEAADVDRPSLQKLRCCGSRSGVAGLII